MDIKGCLARTPRLDSMVLGKGSVERVLVHWHGQRDLDGEALPFETESALRNAPALAARQPS